MEKFTYGSYSYQYQCIKQDRKTLSLTVWPDLRVVLKCPRDADKERVEKFLKRKWFWLEKQQAYFKKHQKKILEKEYVSGESFLYLGRQYKLVVRKSKENRVSLLRGKIVVYSNNIQRNAVKKLLDRWYCSKMSSVSGERYDAMIEKFDYKKAPNLKVREMEKRWGSFTKKGSIYLNPKLIYTPIDCIDYVIVHELCHLKYKLHNKNFFDLLSKKYRGWKKIKDKLDTFVV